MYMYALIYQTFSGCQVRFQGNALAFAGGYSAMDTAGLGLSQTGGVQSGLCVISLASFAPDERQSAHDEAQCSEAGSVVSTQVLDAHDVRRGTQRCVYGAVQ